MVAQLFWIQQVTGSNPVIPIMNKFFFNFLSNMNQSSKSILLFTFNQLVSNNIHLGGSVKLWNSLNKDLIFGFRQNYYFLNLNLSILNIRKSFLLIETLLIKNSQILFYIENLFIRNLILKNYFILDNLRFNFGLGRWIPGFLSNFKVFIFLILNKIKKIINYLKIKKIKKFITLFLNKFWSFFLFLNNLKLLPSTVLSFSPNSWLVAEARSLLIPSIIFTDSTTSEQLLNQTCFLIPFNFINTKSLLFLFFSLKHLLVLNLFKKKRFFLLLIFTIIKLKKTIFLKNLKKNLNLGFSLLYNLLNLNSISKVNKNKLVFLKLIKLLKYKNY